jgi:AraC family transcriptional regulator
MRNLASAAKSSVEAGFAMQALFEEAVSTSKPGTTRLRESMRRVIRLLETAVGQLHDLKHPAQGTVIEAALLLRQQIHPLPTGEIPSARGHLLAWQVRKVHDYIESHIAEPLLVADLCGVVQRSEAHFSRCFKRTFGESPHSFVMQRRVEIAARYMLTTDVSLSDIALRCGFADQAHLCKHFRHALGQTPAAWRRAQVPGERGHDAASEEICHALKQRYADVGHIGLEVRRSEFAEGHK